MPPTKTTRAAGEAKARARARTRPPEPIASKLDGIREQVRAMIQRGELRPGERVNEQALANQIGVGRNSAREALRSLEQAGLVQIVPNRGAQVRRLSLEEALDLYEVRAGLARTAGRLAALRITGDEERALSELLAAMDQACDAQDTHRYQDLNIELHRRLMLATKNPRLIQMNRAVEEELTLYLPKGVFTLVQMRRSATEHRAICDALSNGQAVQAADAFESHVLTGKQRMLDTLAARTVER